LSTKSRVLLVGDNPFHGISHLSQDRVRDRGKLVTDPENASALVSSSLQNGASGFMFSVSDTTLSIIRKLSKNDKLNEVGLYALVPYAYEYVRLATHAGGVTGLGKSVAREIALSGNFAAASFGLKGILANDPIDLMKAYLLYEISRIKASAKRNGILQSVLLHEVLTDMALALNLEIIFETYIKFLQHHNIKPGFETRNFPYLINKFNQWGIGLENVLIAAPFNKVGFYMNPSKEESEKALLGLPKPNVIAMSVLAAGYLKPSEAIQYIDNLPNIYAVVVGVSKEEQARGISQFLQKGNR